MEPSKGLEYKVGIFVAISIILTMAFIIALGGEKAVLHRSFILKIKASETGGLSTGGTVQLAGIPAGNVVGIEFDSGSNGVIAKLKIDRRFMGRITKNSTATLQTQGALGDKYVLIQPGAVGADALNDGDFIPLETGSDLISTLGKSGSKVEKVFDILDNLDKITTALNEGHFATNLAETSRNLKAGSEALQEVMSSVRGSDPKNNKIKKALDHLANIMEKIDNGQGTLGGLINDPTVHEDLKQIMGGAKRSTILKYLIRQTIKNSEEDEENRDKESKKK